MGSFVNDDTTWRSLQENGVDLNGEVKSHVVHTHSQFEQSCGLFYLCAHLAIFRYILDGFTGFIFQMAAFVPLIKLWVAPIYRSPNAR